MQVKFFLDEQGVLFFELLKKTPEQQGPDTHIVLKATKDHADGYQMAYEQFRVSNPDFKAPWEPPTSPVEPTSEVVESLLDAAKLENEKLVETEIQ